MLHYWKVVVEIKCFSLNQFFGKNIAFFPVSHFFYLTKPQFETSNIKNFTLNIKGHSAAKCNKHYQKKVSLQKKEHQNNYEDMPKSSDRRSSSPNVQATIIFLTKRMPFTRVQENFMMINTFIIHKLVLPFNEPPHPPLGCFLMLS